VAEKDVASASRYRIQPVKLDLGMFKSSGLLVSTGTGSSAWLYAARQLNGSKISQIMEKLGAEWQSGSKNETTARKLSEQTLFPRTDKKMFFFVREGFSLTQMTEGFCKELTVTSEMLNGEIILDGWSAHDLSLGDKFTLVAADED
jgi:hypothetical protein